ncbi:MAG: acyltransferase [Hallella sp.]|uniref:acyltransferase family protein n=1 Tax=Hallella sp. TaxID=2980186 RepID=UPI00258D6D9A|nr:acyltransferase [Hallella sp.]MDD7146061.1 acyltransferase [Hallella sp.]MDR4001041.1 acyltransferase [Hallella sp.]MDY5924474.1 acyltransferase [Hallella sp.]
MNDGLLTRAECAALRGLAIIGIFLHNYCHWLGPVVKENEYTFSQHNVDWLTAVMASPDGLLPAHLVSFFGHYGVPVFLFLSAYGLELKYGRSLYAPAFRFVAYHWKKLFSMMIVGFVSFTIVDAMTPGRWHYTLTQVVAQLAMVNNLLPDPDHNIWPGPFWFFGLMLQLYVVYRLLLYKRHWAWTAGAMVVCLGVQLAFAPESEALNWYRYNFMGGMLPFGLGLLYARYGNRIILTNLNTLSLLVSVVFCGFMVMWMSASYLLWSVVPLVVCILCVYVVKLLSQAARRPVGAWLMERLVWMGEISAALFVIHPVLRKVFIPISRHGDIYTGLLLYAIAAIGAAWLIRLVMTKIPKPQM